MHCARRETSIPASECVTCADFDGVMRERSATAVLCSHLASLPGVAVVSQGPICAAMAARIHVTDVMTTGVVCVLGDLPLASLMSLFLSCELDEVVVVDGDDRPVGVVGRTDLARRRTGRVADVMTRVRFAIDESATLTEATMLFAYQGLAQVPVVSREGRLVGVLAAEDVCRLVQRTRVVGRSAR